MRSLLVLAVVALTSFANAHEMRIFNNCPFTIWPALFSNLKSLPLNGGFELGTHQTKTFDVCDNWSGHIWARTGCKSGQCATGDCSGKIECFGKLGIPPITRAEFDLDYWDGDRYYISLWQGFNLPVMIEPIFGTFRRVNNSHYDCNPARCPVNINDHCPNQLVLKDDRGQTIGCKDACWAFNTDQYCCRGRYNTAETCKSSQWPINYPAIFKNYCPDVQSYFYDDEKTSTFTCHGAPKTGFVITFCP